MILRIRPRIPIVLGIAHLAVVNCGLIGRRAMLPHPDPWAGGARVVTAVTSSMTSEGSTNTLGGRPTGGMSTAVGRAWRTILSR